jgi:NADPH:quinone reductase
MHHIRIASAGGPETLEWVVGDEPATSDDALIVEVAAAGLNFIDTYQRSGLYPMDFPFTPGLEGAGTVLWSPEQSGFTVGDRVAWASAPGSYAERVAVPASQAITVPDAVALESAAAVMLQGITAHYLATDTFPLTAGNRCLIHAGAGGVGLLLIQIAKHFGAEVFTTVGSEEKAELARHAGADHVIDYSATDFGESVERIAGSRPLDVVYDGVGKAVFERSLTLLRPRGYMVTFGNASGPVDPVPPLTLMREGSLFLTRPTMGHYIATRSDLEARTSDLFGWMADGWLNVRIGARIPMSDAGEAHRMLESRETTGKVILVP